MYMYEQYDNCASREVATIILDCFSRPRDANL